MTPGDEGDQVYLRHILEAVEKCEQYASVGHDAFMESSMRQDAVIRRRNPDVPWRLVAGTRDVLVHDYAGIDLQAVWKVTQEELPPLRSAIETLLAE